MVTSTQTSMAAPPAWHFDNSYTLLPPALFTPVHPTPVPAPRAVLANTLLAQEIGLNAAMLESPLLIDQLCGNALPDGSMPIAQAYMGHQFGYLNMLGDGRAILLGEHLTPDGRRLDIQLKGSGPTPYSRRGDGRGTLSAMLREYIMSEAMYHLGIPTSRSLAVVATGMPVYREGVHEGAVLTRLMSSHIRVGTFEYATRHLTPPEFKHFVHYVIQRHYPALLEADNPALSLLKAVIEKQATLITDWMRVGFIHGVMNTDNMSIAGETFDYGPCAFMNQYNPGTVFSSIDTQGRYAFANQPAIAQWNLAVLAGTLIPLLHPQEKEALALAKEAIQQFPVLYEAQWLAMMQQKLGYTQPEASDKSDMEKLLHILETAAADYTHFFTDLQAGTLTTGPLYEVPAFVRWHHQWQARLMHQSGGTEAGLSLMKAHNPVYIPRNHKVEEALEMATAAHDMGPVHQLLEVLRQPYQEQRQKDAYRQPPPLGDHGYRTFCNT